MISTHFIISCIIFYNCYHLNKAEETIETYCNINGKKPLQYVSDKFLSLSVDPAVLLAGLNLSDKSLLLARHLSPAYIRIAGPSTRFVKYVDNEEISDDRSLEDGNNVIVTPSMWFGINEWLKLANLTPVFGINDVGSWDPKSILPLLEISDKLNVSCYWMLGFDPSQKTEMQYKEDLSIFQDAIAAFPHRKDQWKIVGCDVSGIPMDDSGHFLEDLKDVTTAVMWEPNVTEEYFPENEAGLKFIQTSSNKTSVEVWTTSPKPSQPVSFSSVLLWAEQVGNAAKLGYDVVFRQPRLHEIFSDTPIYWFSLLHKKLMGGNVFDANSLPHHPGSSVYAHCTRKQSVVDGRGALTVMIVNRNLQSYKVKVKLEQVPSRKFMDVQFYILTSLDQNSTDIFLNGKQLTPEALSEIEPFLPEHRVIKAKPYIPLKVPAMSIGFFVLPKATVPVCINEENVTNHLPQEADEAENLSLSDEVVLSLRSRGSFSNNPTLEDLKMKMRKEKELDEKFSKSNFRLKLDALKQRLKSVSEEDQVDPTIRKYSIEKSVLEEKERKQMEMMKRREDLKRIISGKTKQSNSYKPEIKVESRSKYLDLTSEEAARILKDRARARAAQKNMILTNAELDVIVEAVRRKFLDPARYKRSSPIENEAAKNPDINTQLLEKPVPSSNEDLAGEFSGTNKKDKKRKSRRSLRRPRDVNMKLMELRSRLEENRQRLEERRSDVVGNAQNLKKNVKDRMRKLKHKNYRYRRDINLNLLKLKTDEQKKKTQNEVVKTHSKSLFRDRDEKEATIRKPGQTSDELLAELEEEYESEEEKPLSPKLEVFAELAEPDDSEEESSEFFQKPKTSLFDKKQKTGLFGGKWTNDVPKLKSRKSKNNPKELDDSIKFLTASDEFNDVEEGLPCIHEYFGPRSNVPDKMKQKLMKQNVGKQEKAELSDSMEYLRKKRSQIGSDKNTKCELGEIDYDIPEIKAISKSNTYDDDSDEDELNIKKSHSDKENAVERTSPNKYKYEILEVGEENPLKESKENLKSVEAKPKLVPEKKFKSKVSQKENIKAVPSRKEGTSNLSEEKIRNASRRKRDTEGLKKEIGTEDITEKSPSRMHLKQRLKELQQAVEKDKLKFEASKNKIMERKKDQDLVMKIKQRMSNNNDKSDKEKRTEVLEKLQMLRKKLASKKKEPELLTQNAKVNEKFEENGQIDANKKEIKLGAKIKTRLTQIEQTADKQVKDSPSNINSESDVIEIGGKNQAPSKIVKRSLFDQRCDVFGNYKPLTPDLKAWKPSDILSLKRDVNFPSLRPVADFQILKNAITPNKYFSFRRKRRSIDASLDDLENRIDSYINDIEKDSTNSVLDARKEQSDYKFKIPGQHISTEEKHDVNLLLNQMKSGTKEETTTSSKSTIPSAASAMTNDNSGKGDKNMTVAADDTAIVVNRLSDHIQKIPTKEEQTAIAAFISDVAGFFTNIGETLGHYIKNIA